DEPPASERMVQAVSTSFTIPPNTPTIPVHAEHEFDHDVVITGVRARMNERGKNMKFSVEFPDGRRQELLSVAAYNYAWQPHYVLDEPVEVPAGSTVHVTGAFDNSVSNPFNPDPTESVAPGLDITDEMFTGYFSYYPKWFWELRSQSGKRPTPRRPLCLRSSQNLDRPTVHLSTDSWGQFLLVMIAA